MPSGGLPLGTHLSLCFSGFLAIRYAETIAPADHFLISRRIQPFDIYVKLSSQPVKTLLNPMARVVAL